ncbi:MAG: SRPBCC family protein [Actinomycetota bacterium]|nr:SRPBCC family protein [Actinomycetota bacterium]
MRWRLDKVGLEFLDHAPHRFVSTGVVRHPPESVFAAIAADPAGWTWFPGFSDQGRYLTLAPHGAGAIRHVWMAKVGYEETVLVWDEPRRWAFRVDRADLPFARALVENYRVEPRDSGWSEVTWTLAVDPRLPLRPAMPLMGRALARIWDKATLNLTAQLSGSST